METSLNREQIIDLLQFLGSAKINERPSSDDIMFCCTVHGEENPSAGISISKQIFHCFSCGVSGSISWLVYKSLSDEVKSVQEADELIKERYGVDFAKFDKEWGKKGLRRYDDFFNVEEGSTRFELPFSKLAPFKSGKETFQYFFDRGFSKGVVKDFKIGRDLTSETVTIPLFWEDGILAGIIGRYIDPNRRKNERYKIYEFPKSELLFPLDKFEVVDDTIIGVEGILDAIWMHYLGYPNTLSILGNQMSYKQAKFIKSHCCRFVDMFDSDEGGKTSTEIAKKRLGKDIIYYTTEYPESDHKLDPQSLTKDIIDKMLKEKRSCYHKRIKRI
jgi:DNA primase